MKHHHGLSILIALLLIPLATLSAQDATPQHQTDNYVLQFPVPMPTDAQLSEAKACDLQNLPGSRFPASLSLDKLDGAFTEKTACDWAVLAIAYKQHVGDNDSPPNEGKLAYSRALSQNPAYGVALSMLASYWGEVDVVSPPFPERAITAVEIDYVWGGMGSPVSYHVTITHANTQPVVTGTVQTSDEGGFASPEPNPAQTATPFALANTVDPALVQALHPGLKDLLPIKQQYSDTPCWDNYPDWTVNVTLEGSTIVKLTTNQSNVLNAGGPWQAEIKGRNYLQVSGAFVIALFDLTNALNLPVGEPAAMGCGGNYNDPLQVAFP